MLNYSAAREQSRQLSAPLSKDLLKGAQAIADELGEPIRRVYHLLQRRELPAFRWGGRWYCRRSVLRRFIEKMESGAG